MSAIHSSFSFSCDIHIATEKCSTIFASVIVIDPHSLCLIHSHHVDKRAVDTTDNPSGCELFDNLDNFLIITIRKGSLRNLVEGATYFAAGDLVVPCPEEL